MARTHWKKTLVSIAALTLTLVMFTGPLGGAAPRATAADGVKDFTILHTNDEHSELIPYNLAMDYPGSPTMGGFSRLAKTINDVKAAKAAAGEPVLTLGAGDWSQGTLFSWLETNAAPELTLMQQMGYDAVTIGNHEVELGPGYLAAELFAAQANGVNLPLLSANITFSGYPPNPASPDFPLYGFWSATDRQRSDLFIQPYTTRLLPNGLKVGIFGLLGVEAETVAPGMAPLTFGNVPDDESASFSARVAKAREMVAILRDTEHCDVVVALSHMGTYEEELLSALIDNIDVIVGGHSHDLNYPPIVWGRCRTIIVQAGDYSEYLGKLELQYDPSVVDGPKVTVRNADAIRMDQNVGTNPAVDAVIGNYMAGLNAQLGFDCLAKYAETDLFGDGGFPLTDMPPLAESNLGDLITDTYRGAANQVDPASPVDFAIEANGVIRAGVPKGATGIYSFYDLYRSLPLGGSPYDFTTPGYPLVAFYLFGAEIEGVMNQLVELGRNDFFVQASGLEYTYDPNGPAGGKIVSVMVDNGSGVYGPIQPGTLYKLAANYYVGAFLGMFGLFPRDQSGAQHTPPTYPDPMKDFIVHPAPGVELKCWQALTGGVAAMPDLDGDGLANMPATYFPPQGRITALNTASFFAEGTCRPGFDPYIAMANTGGEDATVKITYMLGDGTGKTQDLTVPAGSRATVHPPDVLGTGDDAAHDFSAKVECTNGQQVIAERPTYFDYGGSRPGGHDAMGESRPGTLFYFAEGTCRPDFEPYLAIQNTADSDARVTITYMKGDGSTLTQKINVSPQSRYTIAVKSKLGEGDDAAHDFSAKVECTSGQGIVVERPMYFDYLGRSGGSDVMGATSTTTTAYFAEGTCRPAYDPYIAIANMSSGDASVKVTYLLGDGTQRTQDITIPQNSRGTVHPTDVIGVGDSAAFDFSATVESLNGAAIVAERPMYFNHNMVLSGGHDVMGAGVPSLSYFFAEGTCRPGFDPFIAVANVSSADAVVRVTYLLGDGTSKTQDMIIPARSRATVHPPDVLGTGDDAAHDFSATVECTNGMAIVAERPIYFDYRGLKGGTCVLGH
ncbi:MAG: bifunctional UDP-sugar hydrolase/5'-nucleotidase [Actinomycetota bacterium]